MRSDAELVAAYLDGQREALAAMYDRYAGALHDVAAAMTRSQADAEDLTHDVFLTAAERMGQLRDPSRLKPWLFAILRHNVFDRSRWVARTAPLDFTDPEAGMDAELTAGPDPAAEGGDVMLRELARDVRHAAQGLDERDRLVLELTARQGLTGAALADALGVTLAQSYVVVNRMRVRVERSLGAYAIARAGRRDCPELAAIIGDWDGELTVLLRKRIARHAESCPTCANTKRRVGAFALVGLAPAVALPDWLRSRVVADAQLPSADGTRPPWRDDGFPPVTPSVGAPMRSRVPCRVVAAVAAVAAAIVLLLAIAVRGDDDDELALVPAPVTTAGATSAIESASSPPATSPSVDPSPSTTAATTAPDPTDADDIVGTTAPPTVVEPTVPPAVEPTVPPAVEPTVPLAAEPTIDTTVPPSPTPVDPPSVTDLGVIRAMEAVAPFVEILDAPANVACPWSVPPRVSAAVVDASALDQVVLSWTGPGDSGSVPMVEGPPARWSAPLDLPPVGGTWAFTVAATDEHGNTGEDTGTVVFTRC